MTKPVMLIVEDEFLIRECAFDFAEEAGYAPLLASCAAEALDVLQTRQDISVLFTDITMPGEMDGLELARTVRERWPTVRILIATGAWLTPGAEFPHLTKPYGLKHFVEALEELVS